MRKKSQSQISPSDEEPPRRFRGKRSDEILEGYSMYQQQSRMLISDVSNDTLVYLDDRTVRDNGNYLCSAQSAMKWQGVINRKCYLEGKENCEYLCCGRGHLQTGMHTGTMCSKNKLGAAYGKQAEECSHSKLIYTCN